jgi:hypothetical protein
MCAATEFATPIKLADAQAPNLFMNKSTQQKIVDFAGQYAFEDWGFLCTKPHFLNAVDAGDIERATKIAKRHRTFPKPTAGNGTEVGRSIAPSAAELDSGIVI